MSTNTPEPKRTRPDIPKDYGVPEHEKGMVEWSWVTDELKKSHNYWLVTIYPDGRPHCVPSWGAWVENKLYFSGGDMTRHAKNLLTNPNMIAHLENGDQVIIVYGVAHQATNVSKDTIAKVEADYVVKYGMGEGATYFLVPQKILAWTAFPNTPTRFLFD